ncbi:MAG: hypothetical protein Q9217_006563 [Psora testacea]
MAVFDKIGTGDMVAQLTTDANVIQEGISPKLSLTLSATGTLVPTFVVNFMLNWKFAFMLSWSIVLVLTLLYGANSIIEEALDSIKSTTAMGMQDYIANTYDEYLNITEKAGVILKSVMGTMVGIAVGTGYLNVALAFWQGSRFLVNGQMSFQAVVAIILIIKSAAFCVLSVGQNADAFTSAIAAAERIFQMISRVSPIDSMSGEGLTLDRIQGTIELEMSSMSIHPGQESLLLTS